MADSSVRINARVALDAAEAKGDLDRFIDEGSRKHIDTAVKLDSAGALRQADTSKDVLNRLLGNFTSKVELDDNGARAKALDLKAQLDRTIGSYMGKVDLDSKKALSTALQIKLQLDKTLKGFDIPVDLRADKAEADLAKLDVAISAMSEKAADVDVDVQTDAATAKLLAFRESAVKQLDNLPSAHLGIDDLKARADVLDFIAEIDLELKDADPTITAHFSSDRAEADMAAWDVKAAALSEAGGDGAGNKFGEGLSGGFSEILSSPAGLVAIFGTAIAALPFIAQVAAGGIVGALGGALVAIPVIGALQNKKVKADFSDLEASAVADLGRIGTSFVPVMESVAGTAGSVLNDLEPTFASAAKIMAKPFEGLATAIGSALEQPSVKSSITDIAKSFSDLVIAVTPTLGPDINDIAVGISKMAKAVAANPGAIADFIGDMAKLAGGVFTVLGALTTTATWIERNWDWMKWIVVPEVAALQIAISALPSFEHAVSTLWDDLKNDFTIGWDGVKLLTLEGTKAIFDAFATFVEGILNGAADAFGWIPGIGGRLKGAASSFDSWASSVDGSFSSTIASTKAQIAALNEYQGSNVKVGASIVDVSTKLGLSSNQTSALTAAMAINKGGVDNSKSSFDKFASSIGISKTKADDLWSSLKNVAGDYKANVNVAVTGGGTISAGVKISYANGVTGVSGAVQQDKGDAGVTANGYSYARGGIIPGGIHGRDSVPIMAAPGELIIPASHAPKFAALAKDKQLPGYAGGGLITANSAFSQAANTAPSLANLSEPALATKLGNQTANVLSSALASSLKAAQQQALAAQESGPLGPATAGSVANGAAIFKYLMAYAHMTPTAAAGAIASIWGESGWNPMAAGTGGRGLIGWTPAGTISDANYQGGLATQLPQILRFISTSGDWGVISEMNKATSVFQAANEWGKGVERYGINDVHAEGISLASSILNNYLNGVKTSSNGVTTTPGSSQITTSAGTYDTGGVLPRGLTMAMNGTGQSEYVLKPTPYAFDSGAEPIVGNQQAAAVAPGMPGMTQYQGSDVVQLLATLVRQNTQMASRGRGGAGAGVAKGYWSPQS